MTSTPQRHLLFLSHAGVDRAAAEALATRIEENPTAKSLGLAVWVDTRGSDGPSGLRLGENWHQQLERAISDSTAFAVYVPPQGASFWVDIEMRLAIERVAAGSVSGTAYPFIPIVGEGRDLKTLPPTARLFQASLRSLDDGLEPIIRAVLKLDDRERVKLVDEPFMGLGTFDAERAALFFGREEETRELVDRLKATNFVVVVSDSGAGKSSLAKAGLVPRFREGVFADRLAPGRPVPADWHVVEMRPGRDPFEGLVDGVATAAKAARVPFDSTTHGEWIRSRKPGQIRDALREAAGPNAKLLLVVDQFEELWTLTPDSLREEFIAAILELAPPGDFSRRVVATMRRDYFNLCGENPGLAVRLGSPPDGGRFLLRRMSPEGLRVAITKPLALAGERATDAKELADAVLRDVTDQPGDLALLEMALTETWRQRSHYDGNLVRAYEQIGRVEGALATAAEDTFANPSRDPEMLSDAERPIAESLFMRLVLVGDAQGATRRVVRKEELTAEGWRVAQKLATKECRRLLVVRERDGGEQRDQTRASDPAGEGTATAELAHEQLVKQWGRYQRWLRSSPEVPTRAQDKLRLDRLMDRAERWRSRGRQREDLAGGSELVEFGSLAKARDVWLSESERGFVRESANRRRQRRITTWASLVAVVAILVGAATVSTVFWRKAETRAVAAEATLLWHPLEFRNGATSDEIGTLWKLGEAPPAVRAAFLQQMIENEKLAERFARAPGAITHALIRVDRQRRQVVVDRLAREATSPTRPSKVQIAAGLLAIELEDAGAVEPVLAAIQETRDFDQLAALVTGLAALSARLDDEQAARAVGLVLAAIQGTKHSEQLAALGRGLAVLSANLSDEQAARAVGSELAAIQGKTSPYQFAALGTGLAALSARLSDEQVPQVFEPLLAAIREATDSNQFAALGMDLAALSARLSDEQAARAVEPVLAAINESTDSDQLAALGKGLAALSARLSDERAARAVGPVLEAINESTDSDRLATLGTSLAALSARLSDAQAARAVETELAAIKVTTSSSQFAALGTGLVALSARLSDAQAARAVEPVLAAINETTDPHGLGALVNGLAALSARLRNNEAVQAVGPVLAAIDGTTDPEGIAALVNGLAALSARLSDAQAERAIERLLAVIMRGVDSPRFAALGTSLATLTSSDEQAARAVELVLAAIKETTDHFRLQALGNGLAAMSAKLSDELAAHAFESVLTAIKVPMHRRRLVPLGKGLAALSARLSDEQSASAIEPMLLAIKGTKDRSKLWALERGLAALSARVSDEQAPRTVEPVLMAIVGTTDPNQLETLLNSLAPLSATLSDAQAARAAEPVLKAIIETTDPDQLETLLNGLAALSAKLSDAQAARAAEPVLAAIMGTTDPEQRETLLDGLVALSARLSDSQAAQVVALVLAAIKATTYPDQLETLLKGLAALSARLSDEQTAGRVLLEALRCPHIGASSAGDEPRTVLCQALRARFPDAPTKKAGWWALIEWAEKKFPAFDFKSRQPRPSP